MTSSMATITRRRLAAGLGATATLAGLPRTAGAEGAPLSYWSHNYPSLVSIVDTTMAPAFQKATGIAVAHDNFETNELETKVLTAWVGGSGPDLVSTGDNNLPNYVAKKLVAEVDAAAMGFADTKALIDFYEPGALDSFMVGGKLYGIPTDSAALSLFYRRDLFKEAGLDPDKPPTTWEEVTEYGKQLVKRDGNGKIVRAGWGWEARSISSHFYYWGTLLPQAGADFLSADGTRNGFDNPQGMKAFQFLYDTFNTSHISALGLAPTVGVIDDFGTGRIAMTNSGFWLPPSLEAQYPKVTFKDGVYGIARLPQFAGTKPVTRLNPWVWMVSAQSKQQKAAWQFIASMTRSPEAQATWLTQAQYIQPVRGYANSAQMKSVPYGQIFVADTAIGVPTPRTPQFNQLAQAASRIYDQISATGAKPETVVPDFARRVDRLLKA